MEEIIIETKIKVLKYCKKAKSASEIRNYIGISSKSFFSRNIFISLIKENKLVYINKNSINARNQKYIAKN